MKVYFPTDVDSIKQHVQPINDNPLTGGIKLTDLKPGDIVLIQSNPFKNNGGTRYEDGDVFAMTFNYVFSNGRGDRISVGTEGADFSAQQLLGRYIGPAVIESSYPSPVSKPAPVVATEPEQTAEAATEQPTPEPEPEPAAKGKSKK